MKEVLWISLFIPYDKVSHAGGKIHNYYIKALKASGKFDIKLLTFADVEDIERHDLDKYKIAHDIICYDHDIFSKIQRKLLNLESTYNPYNRYGRALQNYDIISICRHIKKYVSDGYNPDVVIMQWTQIIFMVSFIKKCFPNSKIIAIEEDVTYLSYQRKMQVYPKAFLRYISKLSFHRVKKLELEVLKKADLIIVNNPKDERLIREDGIVDQHIFVWTPFFQNYLSVSRHCENHNIIFYGNMGRQENYLSAIWFAQEVMPRLKDTDAHFLIIGANPDKSLYAYTSEQVRVIGYVERVEEYLSSAMCLVAPLIFGAGVKIKVIESLSAGIPVLTNEIGIEGIPAKDGEDFFYCDTAEEYEDCIRRLISEELDIEAMCKREKSFIQTNYNLGKSAEEFILYVNQL